MSLVAFALAAATFHICKTPVVIDGDTIRCSNGVRLRLSGIDAPELPGHCRAGRDCAPGDPVASKSSLAAAVAKGRVTYKVIKTDRYARTVATVTVRKVNLSCWQLSHAQARYVAKWDDGLKTAKDCGL